MGSILSMQWPIQETRRPPRQVPDAVHVIAGLVRQAYGRISVIRGTLSHNDILRAAGYRQQLVGMLQRFWKRDRQSVEAWVEALLRRGAAARPNAVTRPAWRATTASPILHQET